MHQAAQHYVYLEELQKAVGERIAQLLGVEGAMVTSGAAGAIMLATAACVAGKDREKIHRLPDTNGMKNQVIIQKSHRNNFDHASRNVGVRLVEVETPEELQNAITENTAMLWFLNFAANQGQITRETFVEIGNRRAVPTFIDAAADIPPASHLSEYNKMGFDMVAISGGKGLLGPQSTGLLLGRKDLIEADLLNSNPRADTIGRPMKVGKEEMVGILVALERYLKLDHEAELRNWKRQLDIIEKGANSIPGVRTGCFVTEIANHILYVYVQWDEFVFGLTKTECAKQLEEGEPSIVCMVSEGPPDLPDKGLCFTTHLMKPGEEVIVARRPKETLSGARRTSAAIS